MESTGKVKDLFEQMDADVILTVFTNKEEMCPACNETKSIIMELSKISSKIMWKEISLISDKAQAEKYGVTRAPTIIFNDFNIRYTGAPIGLETAPFIQTILMASNKDTPYGDLIKERLDKIKKKGKVMVIVTPTCPYCAQAVLLVNTLAILSEKIDVEIVESYENPDIARKYNVTGVPMTIINGKEKIVGVPNVAILLNKLIADTSSLDMMYG
ncbi:MAG: protein disulfide oxidoreductase [Promethearchaeota archaeon]